MERGGAMGTQHAQPSRFKVRGVALADQILTGGDARLGSVLTALCGTELLLVAADRFVSALSVSRETASHSLAARLALPSVLNVAR